MKPNNWLYTESKIFLLFINYYFWCLPTFLTVTMCPTACCLQSMKMIGSVSDFKLLVQKFTKENVNYWTFCIIIEQRALSVLISTEVVYSFKLKEKSRSLRKGKLFSLTLSTPSSPSCLSNYLVFSFCHLATHLFKIIH